MTLFFMSPSLRQVSDAREKSCVTQVPVEKCQISND